MTLEIPYPIRLFVLQRDNHQCRWCGTNEYLTLHHVVPRRRGGSDRPENLHVFCRDCHTELERLELQWERERQRILEVAVFIAVYVLDQRSLGHRVSRRDQYVIERLFARKTEAR